MTDIAERLRRENAMPGYYDAPAIQCEAADEIERLRADYERLGKSVVAWIDCFGALKEDYTRLERALQDIANATMSQFVRPSDLADYQIDIARAALRAARRER